jgi:hypothetical protein
VFKFYSDKSLVEETIIGNPVAMFNGTTVNSKIMMSEDFRYLIYDIEGSAMFNNYVFATYAGVVLSTRDFANGIKTLANHMFLSTLSEESNSMWKNHIVDLTYCGRNGVHLLLTSEYLQKYDNIPLYTNWPCWKLVDADIPIEYNGKPCLVADAGNDLYYRGRY